MQKDWTLVNVFKFGQDKYIPKIPKILMWIAFSDKNSFDILFLFYYVVAFE